MAADNLEEEGNKVVDNREVEEVDKAVGIRVVEVCNQAEAVAIVVDRFAVDNQAVDNLEEKIGRAEDNMVVPVDGMVVAA